MANTKVQTSMIDGSVGSGTGVNYITNGDANSASSSIFIPYADAAQSRPVDGTGGSPTVTTSINSTNPLSGTKDFKLIKPASNTQGQGWSIPFSVDFDYRTKSNKITASYVVESGTFVAGSSSTDSDVIGYLYDVTNNILLEPSNIKLLSNSTTLSDKYEASFQTNFVANGTASNYRLIFHCATTSALAYTLRVDNISVSPSVYVYGTPITDWQSFTPTGSWTTNTTYTGKYRRVGDSVEINANISLTGAPTGVFSLNVLVGSIDTSKLSRSQFMAVGDAYGTSGSGATNRLGTVYVDNASSLKIVSDAGAVWSASSPAVFGNTDFITMNALVPIVGASSSVQMSDGYDGRVIAFTKSNVNTATTYASSTSTDITWVSTASDVDTVASWNGTFYTILSSGYYKLGARFALNSVAYTAGSQFGIFWADASNVVKIDTPEFTMGSGTARLSGGLVSGAKFFNAGDTLKPRFFQVVNTNVSFQNLEVAITKVQGPQTISASEMIACKYSNIAGTSFSNSGSDILVPFATKVFDTHNAFNVDTFTCPTSGLYEITSLVTFTSSAYAVGNFINVVVYKNGVVDAYGEGFQVQAAVNILIGVPVTTMVDCRAGDTLRIYVNNNRTLGATSLITTGGYNRIEIKRIK